MNWQPWTVEWDEDAADDLEDFSRRDPRQAARIAGAIAGYATSGQGDARKLAGHVHRWRLRIGDWRVIFTRIPATRTLVVLAVVQRKDAYR